MPESLVTQRRNRPHDSRTGNNSLLKDASNILSFQEKSHSTSPAYYKQRFDGFCRGFRVAPTKAQRLGHHCRRKSRCKMQTPFKLSMGANAYSFYESSSPLALSAPITLFERPITHPIDYNVADAYTSLLGQQSNARTITPWRFRRAISVGLCPPRVGAIVILGRGSLGRQLWDIYGAMMSSPCTQSSHQFWARISRPPPQQERILRDERTATQP